MDLELSPQMEILISLAEASSVLPLDKLAKELNIAPGEELEEFLINAIRSKVINVSIFSYFFISVFRARSTSVPTSSW